MIEFLTSEKFTIGFCVGIIALYVGFLIGLLLNGYVTKDDEGGEGGDDVVIVPDSPLNEEAYK